MKPEVLAILSLRILGTVILFLAVWNLLNGLLGSLGELNPTYFGYFFRKVLAGPVIGILLGILVLAASRPLGRRLARGLEP